MKTIQKLHRKALNQRKQNAIKGGDMARDTALNRSKSATKIHNKQVQAIMA